MLMLFLTIILKGISRNFSEIFIHKQKDPATYETTMNVNFTPVISMANCF